MTGWSSLELRGRADDIDDKTYTSTAGDYGTYCHRFNLLAARDNNDHGAYMTAGNLVEDIQLLIDNPFTDITERNIEIHRIADARFAIRYAD